MTSARQSSPAALLLGDGWTPDARGWSVQAFEETIHAENINDVAPALATLRQRVRCGRYAIGYIAYEAAALWGLRTHASSREHPLLWFGLFSKEKLRALEERPSWPDVRAAPIDSAPLMNEHLYRKKIESIHAFIAKGETYQVNYTTRAHFASDQDPLALFLRLYRNQPVPYAAYLDLGDSRRILSLSPELFLRRVSDCIESRPMKGTAPRGRFHDEDVRLAETLRSSVKERAENIMIVDMTRNDLGRVCRYGTVRSEPLFQIERYRTVHQMIGAVSGRLRPQTTLEDILAATFPAASVTGAPKRRTMEIIHELEDDARGVYCGAIGLIRSDDDFIFNVAIRTLEGKGRDYRLGLGGGIVWDSKPELEYRELYAKSLFITQSWPDFELIETILFSSKGQFVYLEEHLCRMESSAGYWGFPFDRTAILRKLQQYAVALADRPVAVRVLLNEQGEISISHRAITTIPNNVHVRISGERVDSNDRFLFHKTTHRNRYNRQRALDIEEGYFETLFVNEREQVTEGCITNLVWRKGDVWFTPPLVDGLLPGIGRAALIRELGALARSVTVDELLTADEMLLGNSVIGTVRVDRLDAERQVSRGRL